MRRVIITLTCAAMVAGLVLALAGSLHSQSRQVKIGVVDLKQISERFRKWINLGEEIEKMNETVGKEIEKFDQGIENQRQMIKNLQPGSEQYIETEIKIGALRVRRRAFLEGKDKEGKKKVEEYGRELFKNIEKAIEDYARRNGYSLIIRKQDLAIHDFYDIPQYVSRKDVMYYRSGMDITNEVVEMLNKRHKVAREPK